MIWDVCYAENIFDVSYECFSGYCIVGAVEDDMWNSENTDNSVWWMDRNNKGRVENRGKGLVLSLQAIHTTLQASGAVHELCNAEGGGGCGQALSYRFLAHLRSYASLCVCPSVCL